MFRALRELKLETNSSERALAILALSRPPELEPAKRQTGTSSPPPFQVHKSNSSSEISTPPQTPPVISSPKRTKVKDDEVPRQVAYPTTLFPVG